MKAINIKWSIDCNKQLDFLPKEIEIPNGMKEDEVSDYLSEVTGFCHDGYVLEKSIYQNAIEDIEANRNNSDYKGCTNDLAIESLKNMEKMPGIITEISKRYKEMIDGKRTLSISEYNDFVLNKLNGLCK